MQMMVTMTIMLVVTINNFDHLKDDQNYDGGDIWALIFNHLIVIKNTIIIVIIISVDVMIIVIIIIITYLHM